jgi:hypothetical protein
MSTYSLSDARKLAEKAAEDMPLSDSEEHGSPKSVSSSSSRLTPKQKEVLAPEDEFEEDELEEGEIKRSASGPDSTKPEANADAESVSEAEADESHEQTAPSLKTQTSRTMTLSYGPGNTLNISTYTEDGERKAYIYTEHGFHMPISEFRQYMDELLEDDTRELEKKRYDEFDTIVTVSLALGGALTAGLILWLYYFMSSLNVVSK